MREIKFRAWYKNEMYYNIEKHHREHHAASGFGGDVWDFSDWLKYAKVMQFTGLKDKNGQGIYEGDIVRLDSFEHKSEIAPVVYSKLKLAFVFDSSGRHNIDEKYGYYIPIYGYPFTDHEDGYEVIGNIHENPELLIK